MNFIVSLEDVRKQDVRAVGMKAASIGELMAAGFVVPPGFVVTADAYRSGLGTAVPSDLLSSVATAYTKLGRRVAEPDPPVAVRSSVIGSPRRW